MSAINMGKVVLGGLLAGLVINIGEFVLNEIILAEQWGAATSSLGIPAPGGSMIVWFVIWGFVIGIAMIWLYAAIRPRCGAGPKTAICAGLLVWFFTALMGFGSTAIMGLFPSGLVLISLLWGLVEFPLAAVAGAWPYGEPSTPPDPGPSGGDQVGTLDSRFQEIFTEVTLEFARFYTDGTGLSEACKDEWVDIFHNTIVKGLGEVGVSQWPKRRKYAFRHVRRFAQLLTKQGAANEITPEVMEKVLAQVSNDTQQALRRLDPEVREFFDALPPGITEEELKEKVQPLFPFCPF